MGKADAVSKQQARDLARLRSEALRLSALCRKTQSRIGFYSEFEDSIEAIQEAWRRMKSAAAAKAGAKLPALADWILAPGKPGRDVGSMQELVHDICGRQLPELARSLASAARGGLAAGNEAVFSDCLSLCAEACGARNGNAEGLSDADFAALARASLALPARLWSTPAIGFSWDDFDKAKRFGRVTRGFAMFESACARPSLPESVALAARMEELRAIDWNKAAPLMLAAPASQERASFWLAATRGRDPSWARARALGMALRSGLPLAPQDFDFQQALEAALVSGGAADVRMALAARGAGRAIESSCGVPLGALAAASDRERSGKLSALFEAGVPLGQSARFDDIAARLNDAGCLLEMFGKELGPIPIFFQLDPRFERAMRASGAFEPGEGRGAPPKRASLDGLSAASALAKQGHLDDLLHLASLSPGLARAVAKVKADPEFEVPFNDFNRNELERHEAAGFPISPAGAIRWWFASGFNAPCPNGAGHLFHVGAAQLEGLFELSRRGCLDEAGAEVAFHEATVGNPDRLRFGKLCLLLGVPFSPSHREELEACIEAEFGGRQPDGEAGWITREAQSMIDAKDIAERAGPAQAASRPAPRL